MLNCPEPGHHSNYEACSTAVLAEFKKNKDDNLLEYVICKLKAWYKQFPPAAAQPLLGRLRCCV